MVIVQDANGVDIRRYPQGWLVRRGLEGGEIAVCVSPNGDWDDPEEYELARGKPTHFVNQWGVRVSKVGAISFWEEIEDAPDLDVGFGVTIGSPSRVTVYVTVPS